MTTSKTKIIVLAVIVLAGASAGGAYYYINNKNSTSDTLSTTIEIDGKKVKVTFTRPKVGDPGYLPPRELKTKEDIALETKDLETLRNFIPAEFRK